MPNDGKYIVMDNASIHKAIAVREALLQKNYILRFISPYSPQLNPIEEFFSSLKAHVRQKGVNPNINSLINVIEEILNANEFSMTRYFAHMRLLIERACVRADFI
ncbi:hypothetical protein DMUE_5294 [Dictyocoela muelleri]|nr:hypothetical protein DMUE_5294 [Dictyocoela muelleri]